MATSIREHPMGPADLDDEGAWDDLIERVVKGAHDDVLIEQARLRALGIIDANGNLLKPPAPHEAPIIDNGGD